MITIKCISIRNNTIATITIIAAINSNTSIICNIESQTVESLKGGTAELLIRIGYL